MRVGLVRQLADSWKGHWNSLAVSDRYRTGVVLVLTPLATLAALATGVPDDVKSSPGVQTGFDGVAVHSLPQRLYDPGDGARTRRALEAPVRGDTEKTIESIRSAPDAPTSDAGIPPFEPAPTGDDLPAVEPLIEPDGVNQTSRAAFDG